MEPTIRRNQIWKHNDGDYYILIYKDMGKRWKCKVMTDKRDVYRGTHTLHKKTIINQFTLIK